jgi:hypothetical protein
MLKTLPAALVATVLPRPLRAFAQTARQSAKPLPAFSHFTDIAPSAGLTQTIFYGDTNRARYIMENMGGGCAFFDYDNDGWLDIFLLGGRTLEGIPAGASNRLYRNNRDGTFADVTEKSGLLDAGWACGVTVGDYNNDGFEDLFLTYYGQNKLYRNNGDGTFTDVTAKAGLLQTGKPRFNTGCTFFDYNRDGHLDLFVSNYVAFNPATAPLPSLTIPNCNYEGVPVNCGPRGFPFDHHTLYRNNGDGTFTDISHESGVAALTGTYGLSVTAFDADEDGWPDLIVAGDSTPSLLLLNNHDGTFREEGLLRGIALSADGNEMAGMGIALGDYNLDGHLDLAITHFTNQSTGFYRNDGKGNFEDVTATSGLDAERRFISWGTGLADLDNDTFPDLFVVTGTVYPELEAQHPKFLRASPRLLFRNLGNGTFAPIDGGPGIAAPHRSRGCAFGDFDNDGDLDILVMNMNEPPSLLRNDAPTANRWLKIRLEGTRSNRSALNTRVEVRANGKLLVQELVSQTSYLSVNDPRLHFGLGTATNADIAVHWLGGGVETFPNIAANQLITIREAHGIVPSRPFR